MKKILFYLVISLLPAYALGQVVCPVPDMGQVAILFSADGASSIGEAEFSLAPDTKVRFATGNLQYCPYQDKWRIAARPYDIVGGKLSSDEPKGTHGTVWEMINGKLQRCTNDYSHQQAYQGWIDLFPWGTSGWYGDDGTESRDPNVSSDDRKANNPLGKVTCHPFEYNKQGGNYNLGGKNKQGMSGNWEKADWGVRNNTELGGSASVKFRTPTMQEFYYIFNTRTNAQRLRGRARIRLICEADRSKDTLINGIIVLPDNWYAEPKILPPGKTFKSDAEARYYWDNEYTEDEWKYYFDAQGAIFLPAAGGIGNGASVKVNRSGFYWVSNPGTDGNCYDLEFGGYNTDKNYEPELIKATRWWCRAVRLVVEITE